LDGRIKPDLVAHDAVSTATYGASNGQDYLNGGTGFFGTSASAPHVAGAAALVKQSYPFYEPSDIQGFLEGRAFDLGDTGKDNLFGSGRLHLGTPLNVLREKLSRNAAGVRSTFTLSNPVTPASNHYQLVDDPINFPDYFSTFLGSEKQGGTFPNLITSGGFYNIPASGVGQGTIERVTVRALAAKHHWPPGKAWSYNVNYHQPSLVLAIYVNGTPYFEPDREMSDGWKVYTDWGIWDGYAASWSTNPNTQQSWTWADIEALQIGLDMQSPYFGGLRIYTMCTQIWVEVEYTP
jgi:hypothetical protein